MMSIRPPDISETTWLGSIIGIGGWICGIFGVAAIFWQDPLLMLGILCGISFATAVMLGVIIGILRRRTREINADKDDLLIKIRDLETDVSEARRQAGEWSATSNNVSSAAISMIQLVSDGPVTATPRVPKAKEQVEHSDNEA